MSTRASLSACRSYFVTGTDTGVGKTLVACALLHACAARGLRAVGMKPVAAGARSEKGRLVNEDVEQLIAAGNVSAPPAAVNPYCFEPPIAPHIAAREAGVGINVDRIVAGWHELVRLADVVVMEGAGGFCVPLNARESFADLAQRIAVPVVMVVGMRLGCLSHALLTCEALRARGLELAGWVANHIDPAMPNANENVSSLQERLAAPLLARITFAENPDPRAVARNMDLAALALPQNSR